MMGKGMFTGMVVLFWLAEAIFGTLVVYWFVTQGFDDEGTSVGELKPLEDSSYTIKSLGMWGIFFAVIILGIVVGA
ncbi:hypothetical protein RYH80_19500 [Halobaculum sp. MBLA0147]|uniref:hypothetical protein n=1 Tax=Halobaculum sp. MBLA0147 TaxID=3079934 RepID=UPI0035247977